MRIIAGTARGRRLHAPEGQSTRPITDRAKEAIFNMLMSQGGVEESTVLDLYAGSGSFGLECLSRGATHVTFVEHGRNAAATIAKNLDTLGFSDRATIKSTSVVSAVAVSGHVDLVFCDPPYADDPWADLLPALDADVLVAHASRDIELTPEWEEVRRRKYGRAKIVLAVRAEDLPADESSG